MTRPVGRPRSVSYKGKICSVKGCDKPYAAKGLCGMHWYRVKHHGSVNGGKSRHSLQEHLANARVDSKTGCKIWPGYVRKNDGYGWTYLDGKAIPAHRAVYLLSGGHIPDGYEVHHTCENKVCVEVTHLQPLSSEEHGQLHGEKWRKVK